ncbi:MAG: DUF1802 family protein [Planctomycetales bacterium]
MESSNRFAFKEWAVICAALGNGRQSLILRKGGIHEGADGFQVEHPEFWLFPTYLHQGQPNGLIDEVRDLYEDSTRNRPRDEMIHLQYYAVVEETHYLATELQLSRLQPFHVWSHRTVEDRFHYRKPGIFLLVVRMYALPKPIAIPNSPHFDGCRTWVDFPTEISTAELTPVLSEEDFAALRSRILRTVTAMPTV